MSKFYSLLFALLMSTALLAQSPPQSFSYQTVIRDAGFNIMANQEVVLKLSIVEDDPQGAMVYQEKHVETTSAIGLINLFIGEGNVSSGSFDAIDWANHTYFLEVAIDLDNDDNFIIMGTSQLRSVPYALYALNAGNANQGPAGPQGEQGIQGETGEQGSPGTNGQDGNDGVDGAQGETGAQGPIGLTGAQGIQGIQGETGSQGEQGLPGFPGTNGQDGNDGVDGIDGEVGAQGPIGLTGPQGIQGIQGQTGEQGPVGLTGADAVLDSTYLDSLIENRIQTMSNNSTIQSYYSQLLYSNKIFSGNIITYEVSGNTIEYTVPENKRLYILNVNSNYDFKINEKAVFAGNSNGRILSSPIIADEGDVISSYSTQYPARFNGVLIDKNTDFDIITHEVSGNTIGYTVPENKRLYILNVNSNYDFKINEKAVFAGNSNGRILSSPIIADEGDVISSFSTQYPAIFNGVLVEDDYFSSIESSSNNDNSSSNINNDSINLYSFGQSYNEDNGPNFNIDTLIIPFNSQKDLFISGSLSMTQPYPYANPLRVQLKIVDDNNNNITAKVSGFKSPSQAISNFEVSSSGSFTMIVRPVGLTSENLKLFFQPIGEFGVGSGSINIQY